MTLKQSKGFYFDMYNAFLSIVVYFYIREAVVKESPTYYLKLTSAMLVLNVYHDCSVFM